MADTKYFVRKRSMNDIEDRLDKQMGLELCFKDKKERIFRNNNLLITCKDKYISVLVYDENNKSEVRKIINMIS